MTAHDPNAGKVEPRAKVEAAVGSAGSGGGAALARIRHDLRTPINHILGYCEMLQEEESLPEGFAADLAKIHSGGRRLLRLITEYFGDEKQDVPLPEAQVLYHELRTPVNYIIGYCELLRELAEDLKRLTLVPDLDKIQSAARTWLTLMEGHLLPGKSAAPGTADTATTHFEKPSLQGDTDLFRISAEVEATLRPGYGRVLVTDDDEANRMLLVRRLERQGYEVMEAGSGEDALGQLRTGNFDLVLLDLVMPGVDGYQVLIEMKSDPSLRHIPVIMISALDQEAGIARCIAVGAEDYLSKPFNAVFLRSRIGACLEKKRLRDQEANFLRQLQEEKRRSDELLHVILPHKVATELKTTRAVRPRRFENVGVLFCDIVEFTAYCDRHSPEEVLSRLGPLIESLERLATRHRLEKIKTIGDSFMAAAGLQSREPNPGLDCVRCGLQMIEAATGMPPHWQLRLGLHVGPVIAGVVGRAKYQYDIWGDTVNTAARMEAAARPGSICVNAETWRLLEPCCIGESQGVLAVKGKGDQEVFRVTGLKPG